MISSGHLVDLTVDAGSWESWDIPCDHGDPPPEYAAALARASERANTDESVITGRAQIAGIDVALIVSEFRFLGGSIGRAAAERIVTAVQRATTERLPLVAAPASGGTRMQEGTPAFVKIVDITRAVVAHKQAGLPYLVYLRHPTTGGVLASWGSLGHLTAAEPGALVGFLGPTVYEALTGEPFPEGVQVADHLVGRGSIDALVPPAALAGFVGRALHLLAGGAACDAATSARVATTNRLQAPLRAADAAGADAAGSDGVTGRGAWHSIRISREPRRPGVRELLRSVADCVIDVDALDPCRVAGHDGVVGSIVCTVASFRGTPCVVVGQDRAAQASRPLGPDDLRTARRWMRRAERLGLPLVTVIDTPGAELSVEAEERSVAGEIARSVETLVGLTVPSVAVILGQGCGGGALALLPARRVVAAEHAWLSPLPLEGASTILHGTPSFAADMADAQQVAAHHLVSEGIVQAVVPEPRPAHEDPDGFCRRVADEIARQLRAQDGCAPSRTARRHEAAGHCKQSVQLCDGQPPRSADSQLGNPESNGTAHQRRDPS